MKKTRGQKSRATVPLNHRGIKCIQRMFVFGESQQKYFPKLKL
jgi:hypothetical protein